MPNLNYSGQGSFEISKPCKFHKSKIEPRRMTHTPQNGEPFVPSLIKTIARINPSDGINTSGSDQKDTPANLNKLSPVPVSLDPPKRNDRCPKCIGYQRRPEGRWSTHGLGSRRPNKCPRSSVCKNPRGPGKGQGR
jgi:hypothetical protein